MVILGQGSLQHCINQAITHNGEPPTCTKAGDGTWVASWPDDPTAAGGIPGSFAFLFVLVAAVGIGITVWKVSTARRLATESGMSPDLATGMTLLTDNGLDATYLAASLRQPSKGPSPRTSPLSRAGCRWRRPAAALRRASP